MDSCIPKEEEEEEEVHVYIFKHFSVLKLVLYFHVNQ
jgi:hypothetical protein